MFLLVTLRSHAGGISGLILPVVRPGFIESVKGSACNPGYATDGSALPCTFSAACDCATRCANRSANSSAKRCVLEYFLGFAAYLLTCISVARFHD